VILIDANLLLYAYYPRAEQHEESRAWLETVLSGPDRVRFAWLTLWAFLRGLVHDGPAAGPLVTDAVLAAIALEHGATVCTTDRAFSRFSGLRWMNPLAENR
jgi:hypothetical protein